MNLLNFFARGITDSVIVYTGARRKEVAMERSVLRRWPKSCQCYFYQVGQLLGVDRLAWYAKAGGLGSLTGINLGKEGKGLIPTAASEKKTYRHSVAERRNAVSCRGQGFNLATPLQMVHLTSAIANGGTRYKPIILESITSSSRIVFQNKPQVIGKVPFK